MSKDIKCADCRGFGYTKGGSSGPWEKLDCESCKGTGKKPGVEPAPAKDTLGDRCKLYESQATFQKAVKGKPLLARLDGRAFHTLTRHMKRPYSQNFQDCMAATTEYLVRETHPVIAYTQSDEITLMWHVEPDSESSFLFDGKFQKLTSVLAGMTSSYFSYHFNNIFTDNLEYPHFDCRVWQVPGLVEAADVFQWREEDARKNAITMAAQAYYSHAELHGKSSGDKLQMLTDKGVRFNDYPRHFRAGLYMKRVSVERELTAEELAQIPEQHRPANGRAMRTEIQTLNLPALIHVWNREGVLFRGEAPETGW